MQAHRGRSAVLVGLGALALGGAVWLGTAIANDPLGATVDASVLQEAVQAGRHVRIDGPRGPIHVWIPAGYHADTGATIIYIHGYYDDADTAWTMHQLPEQFSLSALNAMFVVPDAPVAQRTPVNYPDLGEVLRLAEERTGTTRGAALTAVIGHSGAFRTIESWLDEPLIDQIVMVDAMYGDEGAIIDWHNGSSRRRLITVGEDTILGTESVATRIPETFIVDRFPPTYELWPDGAKTARHVYVRAQYGHMALVNEGIVLPSLLRLLPVERLADQPWKLPLGSLPPLHDASMVQSDAPSD